MPTKGPLKTPGVYVTELDAFPPSITGVPTSIPAFIGYTEKAERKGQAISNQAVAIDSLATFEEIFGAGPAGQFAIHEVTDPTAISEGSGFKIFDLEAKADRYFRVDSTTSARFKLYESIRLFYLNGGGDCFVVSVGTYADRAGAPASVEASKLLAGLEAIQQQDGPTLLAVPDAVSLPSSGPADKPWVSQDFQQVAQAMVDQCAERRDRLALLDVYGTEHASKETFAEVIGQFHQAVDVEPTHRSFGVAYFPFLEVSSDAPKSLSEEPLADIAPDLLKQIQNWENASVDIQKAMASLPTQVPSSGAMAGIYHQIDQSRGVWNAPANIALTAVNGPTFPVDARMQGDLNQPIDGKAVNAIRLFSGRGTVVWGARTLDGNSNDYRYIQVRRTLIYIEQSIQGSLAPFASATNDGATWTKVVSMISSFLQNLWSQGGLMGATAAEAFTVECGLGSTMTRQHILDGLLIVNVTLQMIRPAEFIELVFEQRMEGQS